MSVITGPDPGVARHDAAARPTRAGGYTALGNANALAQWEYCFDRARHRHEPRQSRQRHWDCSVPGSANAADPSWNATAQKLIPAGGAGTGTAGHNKTAGGAQVDGRVPPRHAATTCPPHLERAGQFNPDGNNGYNVEHLRDFNNAAPKIAFGFETQPGHGASANRGEYQVLRNNIGGVAGRQRRRHHLRRHRRLRRADRRRVGRAAGRGPKLLVLRELRLAQPRQLRPRRSPLDAGLLSRRIPAHLHDGAQRRRQAAPADDRRRPAHRQQLLDRRPDHRPPRVRRLHAAAARRASSASWPSNAAIEQHRDRRDRLRHDGREARSSRRARTSSSAIAVRDPAGTNFSPYTFANPSLLQVGINQPINMPVLDHIDLIGGLVTGYKTPGTPGYAGEWPRNTDWLHADGTTADLSVVPDGGQEHHARRSSGRSTAAAPRAWRTVVSPVDGSTFLTMTFRIPAVSASQYVASARHQHAAGGAVRDRRERQPAGRRLHERRTTRPSCASRARTAAQRREPVRRLPGPPGRRPRGDRQPDRRPDGAVSFDVAAWADLWFYSNPIYIEVAGSTVVAGVEVRTLASERHRRRRSASRGAMPRAARSPFPRTSLSATLHLPSPTGPTRRCAATSAARLAGLAARAAAALRGPRRPAVRGSTTCSSRRADDPHTIVVGADVDSEATRDVQGGARPRAERAKSSRRCAASGSTTRCCIARGSRCRSTRATPAIRERVIFKALSVVDSNVKLPPADDAVLRAWFEAHRAKYDEPARFDFQEAALSGDTSEAAVRDVRRCAQRRHARRREGRPARVQGPAAGQPGRELRRRTSPRR